MRKRKSREGLRELGGRRAESAQPYAIGDDLTTRKWEVGLNPAYSAEAK